MTLGIAPREWDSLSPYQQTILTPDVIAHWTREIGNNQPLAEIAKLEQQRLSTLQALRDGIELTDSEFKLVRYFQKNAGIIVSYLDIARHMWNTPTNPITARTLAGHHGYSSLMLVRIRSMVSSIRRKLEVDPNRPQHLANIRGVGYVWYNAPPSRDDGVNYEARTSKAVVLRRQLSEQFNNASLPAGRIGLGPSHPDFVEGEVTDAASTPRH